MSQILLTDEQIHTLLNMPKRVLNPKAHWKSQRGSRQKQFSIESNEDSHCFTVYLRQNLKLPESFSCGLRYQLHTGEELTLTRYNGSDHEHSNPLDGHSRIAAECHIHKATYRYLAAGRKAEHYAERTTRYHNLDGALKALAEDCQISGLKTATSSPETTDNIGSSGDLFT